MMINGKWWVPALFVPVWVANLASAGIMVDEHYNFNTGQGKYEVTTDQFIDAFGVVNNIVTTVFTDETSIRPGWQGARIRKDFWDGVNEAPFEYGVDIAPPIVARDVHGSFESVFGIGAEVVAFYYHFIHFEPALGPNETDDRFLFAAPGPNSNFVAFSGEQIVGSGDTMVTIVPEPSSLFATVCLAGLGIFSKRYRRLG